MWIQNDIGVCIRYIISLKLLRPLQSYYNHKAILWQVSIIICLRYWLDNWLETNPQIAGGFLLMMFFSLSRILMKCRLNSMPSPYHHENHNTIMFSTHVTSVVYDLQKNKTSGHKQTNGQHENANVPLINGSRPEYLDSCRKCRLWTSASFCVDPWLRLSPGDMESFH